MLIIKESMPRQQRNCRVHGSMVDLVSLSKRNVAHGGNYVNPKKEMLVT